MGIVVIGAVFVDIKGYPYSTFIPGGRNAGYVEYVHGGVSRNTQYPDQGLNLCLTTGPPGNFYPGCNNFVILMEFNNMKIFISEKNVL